MNIGKELKWAILALLLCVSFLFGHHVAHNAANAAMERHLQQDALASQQRAELAVKAEEAARATEHANAVAFAATAATYEKEKADAQADADRTAADLRDGNLRLRNEWQGCVATGRLSATAAAAAQPDATADDRAASAGRIVRAAAGADAQIRQLQALLIEERK